MKKILCVCLGNICRSPAAEGIFRFKINERKKSADFLIDSAGTGSWHVGDHPDRRSIQVCDTHGVDISNLCARQLVESDGEAFDFIFGMDRSNIENIKKIIPEQYHHKVHMFDDHEVNDPYYSAFDGFEIMYQQLERAADRWISKIV